VIIIKKINNGYILKIENEKNLSDEESYYNDLDIVVIRLNSIFDADYAITMNKIEK